MWLCTAKTVLCHFPFFSFLKVVDSHFLSFFFPLFLSASYEDSQYKCNGWSYLQIYKLKEKKYYGWPLRSLLRWKHTWTLSMVRESTSTKKEQREQTFHSCYFRGKKALGSDRRPLSPIPCIYPLGLPAAADSLALPGILSHISLASWSVPAGIRGQAC